MKRAEYVRIVDQVGRIVLPVEYRRTLDIQSDDPIMVTLRDGGIFLTKPAVLHQENDNK